MHDFKIDNLNKIKFFIHCVIPSIVWSHTESEFPTFSLGTGMSTGIGTGMGTRIGKSDGHPDIRGKSLYLSPFQSTSQSLRKVGNSISGPERG